MSANLITVHVWRCDRCGKEARTDDCTLPDGWEIRWSDQNFRASQPDDLCDECVKDEGLYGV